MSYFGPNAVVDDDKTRVYDYNEDRAELESSSSVSAPGQSAFGAAQMPRMTPNVPLQPLADMWKNATSASPQDLEQRLRAQPNMWMPPQSAGGPPPMMPPGFMPPPEMMMMMFQNGMPPMPPNGMPPHGMPANGMPANGMPPNGMPLNGMPPMGQMPPSSNGMPAMPPQGMPPNGIPPNGIMPPFGAAPQFWGAGDNKSQIPSGQQTPQPGAQGQQPGQSPLPGAWNQQMPPIQGYPQGSGAFPPGMPQGGTPSAATPVNASEVSSAQDVSNAQVSNAQEVSSAQDVSNAQVSNAQEVSNAQDVSNAQEASRTTGSEQTKATPKAGSSAKSESNAKPESRSKGAKGKNAKNTDDEAASANAESKQTRSKPTERKERAKGRDLKGGKRNSSRSPETEDRTGSPEEALKKPSGKTGASSASVKDKSGSAASGASKSDEPYSLTPKTRVHARSIAENQQSGGSNTPRVGGSRHSTPAEAGNRRSSPHFSSRSNSHNNNDKYHGGKNQMNSEQYYFESELLRPNRRFRHMMSDNDKRHVMEKCVKSMANDDPFVDDFYFHVYSKVHGRDVNPREAAKYYKFYEKGEGSASEKMRQQVQRAVERAQENRQRRKESAQLAAEGNESGEKGETTGQTRHVHHHPMHGSTRPRQALPALFGTGSRRSAGAAGDASNSGNGGASILSSALGGDNEEPTTLISTDSVLRNIENVYDNIMALEEHAQRRPEPTDPKAAEWAAEGPPLQEKLWVSFAVQKPEDKQGKQPFIEMLTVQKGMKAFARSWSQLDPTRRLTVLTRIVVNIKDLEPVTQSKSKFELFGQAVVQPLVHLIGTADMSTILLMADLARSKARTLAQSRIGQLLLTAIISRAEMLSQESAAGVSESGETSSTSAEEAEQWTEAFSLLFDDILPALGQLDVRDDSTWHFLAALALGSDLDRQSELVDLVRKQIFAQHNAAKTAGGEAGERKIAALNLFLNVLGLNATMEDITEL